MFVRRARMPDLSNLMLMARLRYIQSIHEPLELRNPDTLVRYFIPALDRWRCRLLGRERLTKMRANPFYYYLVARTKYYDKLLLDAASLDVRQIINVGSGSDTRAHRFIHVLRRKGVRVLECDQPRVIGVKRRIAKRIDFSNDVEYLPIDFNEN